MKTILYNLLYENLSYSETMKRYIIDPIIYDENILEIEIDIELYIKGVKEEKEKAYSDFIYYCDIMQDEKLTYDEFLENVRYLNEDIKTLYKMINPFILELLKLDLKTDEQINTLINLFFN